MVKFAKNISLDNFTSENKFEKDDFYHSKEGYIVFTEKYHLKRGYCCLNGCKHCPYGTFKKKNIKNLNDE